MTKLLLVLCVGALHSFSAYAREVTSLDAAVKAAEVQQTLSSGALAPFHGPCANPEPVREFTDFCSDPYRAVCDNPTLADEGIARYLRVSKWKDDARKTALEALAKRYRKNPADFDEADFNKLGVKLETVKVQYFELLQAALDRKTEQIENMTVKPTVDLAKETLQKLTGRDLSGIYVMTKFSSEYMAKLSESERQIYLKAFESSCGVGGLNDNAFALQFSKSKKRVIAFCPGHLAGAVGGGNDLNANMRNIFFAASHEITHGFKEVTDLRTYYKYKSCVEKNWAEELKTDHMKISFKDEKDFPVETKEDSRRRYLAYKTASFESWTYMDEVVADYWGAQALLGFMKSHGSGMQHKEKLSWLRESLAALCYGIDATDGVHPNGRFRINAIRRDPGFAAFMGCSVPSDRPGARKGCTVDGETAELMY